MSPSATPQTMVYLAALWKQEPAQEARNVSAYGIWGASGEESFFGTHLTCTARKEASIGLSWFLDGAEGTQSEPQTLCVVI